MDSQARLRINLTQREFEVEGSESFVEGFAAKVRELFEGWDLDSMPALVAPVPALVGAAAPPVQETLALPERMNGHGGGFGSFGEFVMRLPNGSTDVDKMLAAGFFVQQQSGDDAFGTADANKRLTEQGIKLGNPSQCVKQSLLAKRVFQLTKGRYRVSQQGRAYLRQLLGPDIPD